MTTNYTLGLNTGLTQVLSDGTTTYTYGLERISQQSGSTPEYFLGDALGSVRQMTDPAGAISYARGYDPYGVVTYTSGASQTEFGFTGEQYGDSTQLLYLRSRYYNPTDGRFQSRDTWGGDVNRPLSLNLWGYVEGNPVNYIDPTGKIKENESTDAHSIVNDLKLYNVTIRVDWGYSYRDIKGTPCGWREGEWIMKDLKAIQAAVHIMSDGVSFIGGSLKSLIGNVQILPKKTESGASGAVPGEIRWRVQNANSEKYRLYVAIHETGHIISYHDSRMVDYFMTELGAHCSNQPAGSIGYYCNENTQTGVDYDPGPYAGDSNDPIKYMPSLYATKGSYEDFAETWRETAIKAYIDSGNSLYSKEANLVYSHEVYSHDIGERRVVMTSIIDGTWK